MKNLKTRNTKSQIHIINVIHFTFFSPISYLCILCIFSLYSLLPFLDWLYQRWKMSFREPQWSQSTCWFTLSVLSKECEILQKVVKLLLVEILMMKYVSLFVLSREHEHPRDTNSYHKKIVYHFMDFLIHSSLLNIMSLLSMAPIFW